MPKPAAAPGTGQPPLPSFQQPTGQPGQPPMQPPIPQPVQTPQYAPAPQPMQPQAPQPQMAPPMQPVPGMAGYGQPPQPPMGAPQTPQIVGYDPATGAPIYNNNGFDPATGQPNMYNPAMQPAPPAYGVPDPNQGYQPGFDPALNNLNNMMMPQAPTPAGGDSGIVIDLSRYDFSQVQTLNFAILDPAIEYEFLVEKIEGQLAKGDRSEMLKVTLCVCWPTTYGGQKTEGARIWDYMSMKPDAQWRIKSFLEACELLSPQGRFIGQSMQDAVGNVVRARIKNDEFNGAPTNKINGAYRPAYETPGLIMTNTNGAPMGAPAVPQAAPPAAPVAPAPAGSPQPGMPAPGYPPAPQGFPGGNGQAPPQQQLMQQPPQPAWGQP